MRPQRAKLNKVLKEEQIVFTELRGVRGQKRGKAGSNRAVLCNVQYARLSLEERTLSPSSLLVLIALPVTFSAFLRAQSSQRFWKTMQLPKGSRPEGRVGGWIQGSWMRWEKGPQSFVQVISGAWCTLCLSGVWIYNLTYTYKHKILANNSKTLKINISYYVYTEIGPKSCLWLYSSNGSFLVVLFSLCQLETS